MSTYLQVPALIMPTSYVTGNEVDVINNLIEHTSLEVVVKNVWNKTIHITAEEIVAGGVPGNLWIWIELSPVASTTSASHWSAVGGGGGQNPATAPTILIATGVDHRITTAILPWNIHSVYARVVVQTPVSALPATNYWNVQAYICGQKP
jgi:hypothetical protein